jgi:putative PIN family toxin of toxin-antitoxin system
VIVAVLDTNVLASGFEGASRTDSVPGELLRRWRARAFELVLSEPILAELARVFRYPYFTRRLSAIETEEAFSRLYADAKWQPLTEQVVDVAAHPHDDLILATALSAQAPYLVTGDKLLLEHVEFRGTRIVSPRQFLDLLDQAAESA